MTDIMEEPQWRFIDELQKPVHRQKPVYWHHRTAGSEEASLAEGIAIDYCFPDPRGLLQTALADFESFLSVMEIRQTEQAPYHLVIQQANTPCFEAFRLIIGLYSCTLEAADTEGIRRGLVVLEEELQKTGAPVLQLKTIERSPVIRTRLSRCFFGPIKRPPMNRDELEEDTNYYPDEYLNRLAHEGVNGLWLTITFRDTVPSKILPGFGRRADIHIPKLRETVIRCARYGIKVYVFFIEPTAFIDERNNARYNDIRLYEKDYTEIFGNRQGSLTAFCPGTEMAKSYLYEAANTLFTLVPGLGGMIDISVGERLTHCWSSSSSRLQVNNCPRCATRKPYEVLADVLTCFQTGMHDANPNAEFISWPYEQHPAWGLEKTVEAAGNVPKGVILQHNFESGGTMEQLGKNRFVGDYWLSYVGPSDVYHQCAIRAVRNGTRMFAKLQVGCSHEVASVTHVPVPGNLYLKYEQMHKLGISGAMQSWFFGNYPSMMTRAAGRLSFGPFPAGQEECLRDFAQIDWGPYAGMVVKAWGYFQKAYGNYPLYHIFGYYAPMHDGLVWPLYLKPVNKPLIPNWRFMPEYPDHGDRMGECMHYSHTYEEVLLLCSRMQRLWNEGVAILDMLAVTFANDHDRIVEINNARALGLLFSSGYDILRFYYLREALADFNGLERLDYLARMKEIVHSEIARGEQMIGYCDVDPALGFNSEHEGYRFYPEKLRWRLHLLQILLDKDFPEIEQKIKDGLPAFPEYTGQKPDRAVYVCSRIETNDDPDYFGVNWDGIGETGSLTLNGTEESDGGVCFKACHDGKWLYLAMINNTGEQKQLMIHLSPQRLWPERTYLTNPSDGTTRIQHYFYDKGIFDQEQLDTRIVTNGMRTVTTIRIAFDELRRTEQTRYNPLRINIKGLGNKTCSWVYRENPIRRLAQSPIDPDDYGWFWFE